MKVLEEKVESTLQIIDSGKGFLNNPVSPKDKINNRQMGSCDVEIASVEQINDQVNN